MSELKPLPCPFCGGAPRTVARPDNIDGTQFFYALACYCGGYSACAHKMAVEPTPEQAKRTAIEAWNRRAQPAQAGQDFTEQLREVARRAGTPTDHACDCGRKWKHTTYGWASTEPAQAGQVLTDDRLLAMWEGTDGERALRPTLGKNKILSFAHAIEQAVMAKRVPQWLPIETAPKDFVSEFDGWNGERVPNVSWAHPEYSPKGHFDWCVSEYETGHGWVNVAVKNLTHWMPLPPPPGIVGEKGGA